jgi:hypothetical protein
MYRSRRVSQGGGVLNPQFPGVCSLDVGPPHVRKCHPPSNVIQRAPHPTFGWVVRWALSTPPRAIPRLGGVCACRASASLAPLYSPCASSAFDWGSKPHSHSRSAPAPVRSSPGLVLSSTATGDFRAARSLGHLAPNRDSRPCTASQPCAEPGEPPPVADEVTGGWRMGLFQTSSKTEATGAFLWLVSPHLK